MVRKNMKTKKIVLIGAGNIGGTLAHLAMIEELADVVLFDIVEGLAQGKALDLSQSRPIAGTDYKIIGTNNYKDIQDAEVVLVSAGFARKPGMSRDDLLACNNKVMMAVGEAIKTYCGDAFVICITNPIDVMVSQLQKAAAVPDNMIVGMAGLLDSARFRCFLADEFKVSVSQVRAFVLGGHGDTMVPLKGMTNIAGITLENLVKQGKITNERLNEIVKRTQKGGGEIVALLKNSSAFYTPATAGLAIAKAYMRDKKNIFPCAVKASNGVYGIDDPLFVGLPAKIGGNGVEEIIEVPLTEEEKKLLQISIDHVRELNAVVAKF